MSMMHGLAVSLITLGGCGVTPAWTQDAAVDGQVRVEVISEVEGVEPGSTAWVGIRFDIEDDWYIYWPGQNETGMATTVTPSGPATVRFGEVLWPAPHRKIPNGDTLDHALAGRVTALLPVYVTADAEPGMELDLQFAVDWVVCKDACIPGSATVRLKLPVVAEAGAMNPDAQAAFQEARGRLPLEIPRSERLIVIQWEGNVVTLRARGADHMAFYPDETGGKIATLLKSGVSESDSLRMFVGPAGTAKPGVETSTREPLLSGVVEVFSADGRSRAYRVRSAPSDKD